MRIGEEIYPRPTVLITTVDSTGKPDVATFSFVMPVSMQPKYIAFAVSPRRHTYSNLKEVPEFVLNVADENMLREVWVAGILSGRDTDKFEVLKLEILPSNRVRPPRVAKSPIQLECVVEGMEEYGDHWIVVGRVVEEHIAREEFTPILHYGGRKFYIPGKELYAEDY